MGKFRKKDPYWEREKEKYGQPVPSREFIMQYLEDEGHPVAFNQLTQFFGLKEEEELEGFRRRLKAMQRDGQIITNRRGRYALVKQLDLVSGRVHGHRDGYGFLIPDDVSEDVFLSARQMQGIFHNDRVLVRVTEDNRGRREGTIVEVLERNTQQVVGTYFEEGGISFVDPDNKLITQDIIIPTEERMGAKNGQFVVVAVTVQPHFRRQPMGKIIEILGDQLTPGMEVELAIRSHELPFTWSSGVLEQADNISDLIKEEDKQGRLDLRHLPFVTIDGEDAKDFDDAVYCEALSGKKTGWRLYVAIADVSHYVGTETPLDQEALKRGNSVYFPNRVIPMLPEKLSNGICSLKPKQDRLVVVCEMTITAEGELADYQFSNALIHSHARLTYTEVASMIEDKTNKDNELLPHLKVFHQLFKKLLKHRQIRGALDFDTIETRIIFSPVGKIVKIIPVQRNDAHRMIEEAMLLANVSTADFLLKHKIPALYRIHQGPEREKLTALRDFLQAFGLRLGGRNKPTSMEYAKLLNRIEKRSDAHLLQTVLLRSLRQAVYSPKNVGHFGLAYDSYTHFTSPIRRYPDLLVHRAIKHILKELPTTKFTYTYTQMESLGEHCSMTERRADLANRDAVDWLKCDYMRHKLGESFDGIISDVTGFGLFIELNDIYVQGLLHVTSLPNDYYHYDAVHHLLRGRRSGKTYRLGDKIRILVARVDMEVRKIDFELVEQTKQR